MRLSSLTLTACVLSSLPTLSAQTLAVLTQSNRLAMFDVTTPGQIASNVGVMGLMPGESLLGIDFRPANGRLYGLGSTSRLYVLDPVTGAATVVGMTPFSTLLAGTEFGFDFNPTVDRIRVTSNTGQNMRLHPDTGAVAAVDLPLGFAVTDVNAGRAPNVAASAYTNNVAGATTTTLYDLDTTLDVLTTQIPPNNGVLNTVGSLGINATAVAGFDIAGTTTVAYAALMTPGSTASQVFTINLTTGLASFRATIGLTEAIRGLSVLPTPGAVQFGVSTPGCQGPLGIAATSTPRVGNNQFTITCANAPINSAGLLGLCPRGLTTPLNVLGLLVHLDPTAPLWFALTPSNAVGVAQLNLPIAAEVLPMTQIAAQFFWPDSCIPVGLSASNALAITVQP